MKAITNNIILISTILSILGCSSEYKNQLAAIQEILDANGITNLTPQSVSAVSDGKIWDLRLENMSLKVLPSSIGELIYLEELDLNLNVLKTLPPEIGNCINLTKLEIIKNKLKSLPETIGNLTKLEVGLPPV